MRKSEFIKKLEKEDINLGEFEIELESITDDPYVMGCCFDEGVWKVFKTRERLGHYIIKKFNKESEAFNYFYELVLIQHKKNFK
ncbi:hypothetical protein J5S49_15480 [Virgibacillus halodenitrificans]|uniref:Uncharacterized protein n=1 Tax=Virgibacillus halodenitrificans TaxID=1482 RepID=A0ABR7VM74_VIRHA|nr:hypothetical protein [Virgibacillus halodenitrificans]MBD1221602.1 hypothetical protein [Virgibacillus halodenitrificans]MCG1029681.1 hypothetical protein [Virgibacillus halodenitrificans]MCJ0932394.1 hypothetical protein [Virgibacillus halodenitrificans]MYL58221.1 hypothetical protein [Virgibacillus halodenitrificans]